MHTPCGAPKTEETTMITTAKFSLFAFVTSVVLATAACQPHEGPAERAGKSVDNAAEKAGDKIERAGDKIEDAAKK
jgi:hypothetical protein